MSAVLYNCKRCKVGRRVEYPNGDRVHLGYGRYTTHRYRLDESDRKVYPGSYGNPKAIGDGACNGCGRAMTWNWLQGFTVETVPCDARCTGARGFKCDCSCGGKNHGAGWGQLGAPIASLLAVAA